MEQEARKTMQDMREKAGTKDALSCVFSPWEEGEFTSTAVWECQG